MLLVLGACSTTVPAVSPTGTVVVVAPSPAPTDATPQPVASLPTPVPTVRPSPTAIPTNTLLLWTSEYGPALDLVRSVSQEFAQQNDLTITVVAKNADSLRVDMLTSFLAGVRPPDIIWGNQDDLAGLLQDGHLQPLGSVESAGDFLPAAMTGAARDGQLWGLPLATQDFLLLLYNRRFVAAPPQTTDELIVQSRAAEGTDHRGLVLAWTEARWLVAWYNGFGQTVTSSDGITPTLNTQEMSQTLYLLRELAIGTPADQRSYADAATMFRSGQAAMMIDGSWAIDGYRTLSPTVDLGIAPMPVVPSTGRQAAPALGATYLMFHRDVQGERLEHARAFGRYLSLPDVQLRIARTLERLPALRVVLAAPDITSNPVLAPAALQAEAAVGLPPTKAVRCSLLAINAYLPSILNEEMEQQAALEAMQYNAEQCSVP